MSKHASPLSRLTAAVAARSPQRRGRTGGGLWRYLAAAAGGLAAGAGAAHLLYSQGHKVGVELRAPRPEVLPPPPPTPADYDAKEPGRGRLADRPHRIPHKGWTDIVWRAGASYFGDRVGFVAGGVTFFTLLSLFPLLGSFVTLYGLFADPADAWGRLQFLYALMPDSIAEFLGAQMQRLAENPSTQLTLTLIWTLILSLWAASGAVKMLFYGLNVAYHETEKRNFIRYNLVCLTFTIGALIALLVTSGLVVGVPVVVRLFGLEEEWGLFAPLRWPLLFAGYVLALMGIYRYGPCRQNARWRWLTPGAIFAATLSVSLSLVFSWYLSHFVRTDSYGPLAAMMGFLLWTWLSVQVILLGAALNAEIEHQTAVDTTTGKPLPLGQRGAMVADSVGPRRGNPAALAFTQRQAEAVADKLLKRRLKRNGR
ncbi:MAG: YihY/virulence factor BrkB family protein [Candidatus Brevundimonas colombiensis]|uniref:YihY/virulence factor BrkB family protein n=1 Tax=Candidatus Brevundimonas colombiensis TaxID=3121376 RepID=A0AAJ6BN35_9CAUL|nr:YihY/virulence factor BrkB family protein [Brevundimonas sp.]WEK41346.1 MAG: YihY/virulence factor BrkB family protein [Brevundimonas sp.]